MRPQVQGELSPQQLNRKKRRTEARIETNSVAATTPFLSKYWRQRYSLFSRYDDGIQMDEEGWFSVTPEAIADEHAAHAEAHGAAVIIDCFAGVGGNAIQFAARSFYVVAIEIDPRKVEFSVNNARIYGVEDKIEFVVGDFFRLAPFLKGDVVFLSPPWGGPSYSKFHVFTLDMLKPKDGLLLKKWDYELLSSLLQNCWKACLKMHSFVEQSYTWIMSSDARHGIQPLGYQMLVELGITNHQIEGVAQ